MPNRLRHEKSPYLLQHQDNPVDWYPWGEEAFERAGAEDRPVFLSVGYATCHWCHVMAHESFEDEEVAARMNDAFVCVKVDREERPDVDQLYMTVCQLMTGHGGWPLTVLLTPDRKPFYVGTYFPKHGRFGRIGMMELVPRIAEAWREQRGELLAAASRITEALQEAGRKREDGAPLDASVVDLAREQLEGRFDAAHGGFGNAPKFPSPHHLLFLLREAWRRGDARALEMVETTLGGMRRGGVFDHVGFGFHRYSTDRLWKLPHFEKMLYDQAMLVLAYTEAFQRTGDERWARTVREVLTYVLRDMTSPEGGFYSAEDADSEGREGAFYVWTRPELAGVLGDDDAAFVERVFGFTEEGNFEEEATREKTGENVLHRSRTWAALAAEMGEEEAGLRERWERLRAVLFEHRERRPRPLLDDKVLTDWNGLMIAACARAGRVLGEPRYVEAAERALGFVLDRLRTDDGRLLHRYRDGEAGLQATVDDHAFLVWGLLECYEAGFDIGHLETALALTETQIERYWDEEGGAFFFTPHDGEPLLVRQQDFYDGALPSGNSVSVLNLLRLGRMTGRTDLEEYAARTARRAAAEVNRMPSAFTALLSGVAFGLGPAYEIVVAGERGAPDTEALLGAVRGVFLPHKVVLLREPGEAGERLERLAPFVAGMEMRDGRATAYVCRAYACEAPITDPEALRGALRHPDRGAA